MPGEVDPDETARFGLPREKAGISDRQSPVMVPRGEQPRNLRVFQISRARGSDAARKWSRLCRKPEQDKMQPADRSTENSAHPSDHNAKPNVRVDCVDTSALLTGSRETWDALALSYGSYFQTPAWIEAWHDVLSPGSRMQSLLAVDDGGRVVGMLHMASMRRNLHRKLPLPLRYTGLAGSGAGAGDHLGPLAPHAVGGVLLAELGTRSHRPVLLERLDAGWRSAAETAGFVIARDHVVPRLNLTGGGHGARSKKVRKEMGRRKRRMAEQGIEGQWLTDPSAVDTHLTELVAVHRARWRSQGEPGLFSDQRLAFLRRLCQIRTVRSRPLMYVLRREAGDVAGALLGFLHGHVFAAYKTGWDPSLQSLGIGFALHDAAITHAESLGCRTYDFLRGTTSHKYTLGASDSHDVTMIRGRGVSCSLLRMREQHVAP